MKTIIVLLLILFNSYLSNSQIMVKPLPEKGFEKRIKSYIDNLKIVDTHEHLLFPAKISEWTSLDFMLLLSAYSKDDIISSGMSASVFNSLKKDSLSINKKWELIKPYLDKSFNTAFCRNALIASKQLFGIDEFDESTVTALSEKIKKAYQSDNWFYEVLDKSKIEYVIQDGFWVPGGGPREFKGNKFRYVARFDDFVSILGSGDINNLANKNNTRIESFDDLLKAFDFAFESAVQKGIVGIKCGVAYSRILYFGNVPKKRAEEIFTMIMTKPAGYTFEDVKPLQDYMLHRIIEKANDYKFPVIFHTGLQTGQGNIIENSKPTLLINLFKQYPEVKFVIYHGGYPYGGELTTLAKNFPNVFIDLCWLYIISPSYAERYLNECLETVPANKIMGFGGDFRNVECTFAHLYFARQVISKVLIDKVQSGYFSEKEGKKVASMILYDNAIDFYKLKK